MGCSAAETLKVSFRVLLAQLQVELEQLALSNREQSKPRKATKTLTERIMMLKIDTEDGY